MVKEIMGCTSSAPSSTPPPRTTSATDEIDEQLSAENKMTMPTSNSEQVLPSSDSVGDHQQLVCNNSSLLEAPALDPEPLGNNIKNSPDKSEENEEKLSTVRDVVEKVIELHLSEPNSETEDLHGDAIIKDSKNDNNVNEKSNQETKNKKEVKDPGAATENKEQKLEANTPDGLEIGEKAELEEAASPSQSTSSRVTRWEALADIAAELPPSLAVDPVTGQIYTLTK